MEPAHTPKQATFTNRFLFGVSFHSWLGRLLGVCDKKGSGVAATGSWIFLNHFGANIPWKLTAKKRVDWKILSGLLLGP